MPGVELGGGREGQEKGQEKGQVGLQEAGDQFLIDDGRDWGVVILYAQITTNLISNDDTSSNEVPRVDNCNLGHSGGRRLFLSSRMILMKRKER